MSQRLNCLLELADAAQLRLKIGELQDQLKTAEVEKQNFRTKFEKEQEENKGLRLTLALRTDCEHELARVRNEKNPGVEELENKLVSAEKELFLMESTKKELMATLNSTRGQLGKMLRERNEKMKEVEHLEERLDQMENSQKPSKSNDLHYDFEMNNYSTNMKIMLDEMNDQSSKWESEKAQLIRKYEQAENRLMRENEKLKAQKEDIVNHSKNSEKMWTERFERVSADLERLELRKQNSKGIKTNKALFAENEAQIQELDRKLKDALEAIEEIEDANLDLRDQLENVNTRKAKLEQELDFQKHLLVSEQDLYLDSCHNYDVQMSNLNQKIAELEEIRDALKFELIDATEKQTQQTITFSNEKAKFCHDMERIEEKWHNEVLKLREQNEVMERMLFNSTKEAMDKKELFEEEHRDHRQKIEELDSLLNVQTTMADQQISLLNSEIQALKDQLTEIKSNQESSVKEWDDECADLEDEIYDLIDKRKTEAKKMRTMARKNVWLTKSIRKLSEQRRNELELKKVEIQKLNSLCELHRMEKVEWLSDLKKEVNAWKDETSVRMEMKKQIEELQKQNAEFEEKIENVTATWRRECEVYENNIALVHEERAVEREKFLKKLDTFKDKEEHLYANIGQLVRANEELEKVMKTQKIETSDLQKATVELSKMEMDNLRALMDMEKNKILNEKAMIMKSFEKKLKAMTETATRDRQMLIEANGSVAYWQNEAKALDDSYGLQLQLLKIEIDDLKDSNQKLKENMGVEELTDDSISSDESDRSDVSDFSEESDSDNAREYDDMPKLQDEREENLEKKVSNEWEMVEEDEDECK